MSDKPTTPIFPPSLAEAATALGIPNPWDGKREIIVPCSCIRKVIGKVATIAGSGGMAFVTIGDDTYQIADVALTERIRKHEDMHVIQREKFAKHVGRFLGTFAFLTVYITNHIRFGYWRNPFEVEARKAETA